jgi:hypothetical protein
LYTEQLHRPRLQLRIGFQAFERLVVLVRCRIVEGPNEVADLGARRLLDR